VNELSGAEANRPGGEHQGARKAPLGRRERPSGAYVIALLASTEKLDKLVARLPAIGSAKPFSERRVVDGRVRYELSLGPFATTEAAERSLAVIRRSFPLAVIRPAREATQALVDQRAAPAPTHAGGHAYDPRLQVTATTPGDTRADVIAADPTRGECTDYFAIELVWSQDPIKSSHIPPLTLFDGHTLYSVSVCRVNHCWHGLRVGFYSSRRQAAEASRELAAYFPRAVVVLATAREIEHAGDAELRAWSVRIDPQVVVAA